MSYSPLQKKTLKAIKNSLEETSSKDENEENNNNINTENYEL